MNFEVEVVTALEILEHLVSPFSVLRNLPGKKLIATVPLRLWFKSAYKNTNDTWDCHYHEFEDWQFDWLFQKSGWNII
ncbi:MAG: methyltransferase, partial [Mariniphaga sp.]|nr:methyltransferase [Mariniphaga sp.]